jgi:hypothetical protein
MAEPSSAGNSSASKSLMWMMIALFSGMAVLLGGGVFLAGRIVRSVGLTATASKDTVTTPIGSFRMELQDRVGPGLPVYPHASLELPSESAAVGAIKEGQAGVRAVTYHTMDTRDFVDSWYSKHLSPEFTRHDAGDKPLPDIFRDAQVSESDIAFVAERGQQVRIVALSLDSTGTNISLIRFEKAAAQPNR